MFIFLAIAFGAMLSKFYRKVGPEEALVRSGWGHMQVATGAGMWVIPIAHRVDQMDLTLKRIEIKRDGSDGLICRDNIRADIKVAFFVRVDKEPEKIKEVAQSIGCNRASDERTLVELFDAKFSEALKTVGKRFDFVDLYDKREQFKAEIIKVIGVDLNGYRLDDCAIDYLEQTRLELLNPGNILDAEGIKKITELTAAEKIKENFFTREKEKTIKKQDVEAQEAILELERQRVEAVQRQERQIAEITARERAQALQVQEENRLKAEQARIQTDEQVGVAEENKNRQIIVALKNRQRTDAVETERVEKDRLMEVTERERLVGVAQVEKEKAIEVENRNIQEVIRERVVVERAVVEEQQRIYDTEQFATADRQKKVAITLAEKAAQEALIKEVKAAEAAKQAAALLADQVVIEAEANRQAAEKQTQATKMLAEAKTADQAAGGLAEAHVLVAKADAAEKQGTAEANVLERKAVAEARGLEAKATAVEKQGTAEANVMQLKFHSEAAGIEEKANAMKLFDGVGKEHEEFKLRLNKDKDIEIAAIDAQRQIAEAQSNIVGQALKSARIDIVGGETAFFDKIVDSIKGGKAVDRFVHNSEVLTDVKNTFFNGNPDYFRDKLQELVGTFNLSFDDIKDLSIAALIAKLMGLTGSDETRHELARLLGMAADSGLSGQRVSALRLNPAEAGNGSK
ncbi:MAG: flotillin family protein [Pirellulaceae bacterium]|nr:flotillin family protein [Pirellulaceae bacterium]